MKYEDMHGLVNTITQEVTGQIDLVNEDLSNIVDVGEVLLNAKNVDVTYKVLNDETMRMIFSDRVYKGRIPSLLRTSDEWGAVVKKMTMKKLPEAQADPAFNLQPGQSYDPHTFYGADVEQTLYSDQAGYMIPQSRPDIQLHSAFRGGGELFRFFNMFETWIKNSYTLKNDETGKRCMTNMMGNILTSTNKRRQAINLLAEYKKAFPDSTVTAANAITDPGFLRFASLHISLEMDRMAEMNTLHNAKGYERFTPMSDMHFVGLSDFVEGMNTYLQADVRHNEFTKLPNGLETVSCWQGIGTNYDWESISSIDITPSTPGDVPSAAVKESGIVAIIFDHWALGQFFYDNHATSEWNPLGEFYNTFYKMRGNWFNDLSEQAVMFYIKDPAEEAAQAQAQAAPRKAAARK